MELTISTTTTTTTTTSSNSSSASAIDFISGGESTRRGSRGTLRRRAFPAYARIDQNEMGYFHLVAINLQLRLS